MNDYERIFDAWEAGGIKGFVFGRTLFADAEGQFTVPAFPSNPQAYRNRGLEPNLRNTETDSSKEKLLHAMLDNAKARGWEIFIFAPGSGGNGCETASTGRRSLRRNRHGRGSGMRHSAAFHRSMGVSWMVGPSPLMNWNGITETPYLPIFPSQPKPKLLSEATIQTDLNAAGAISMSVFAV